MMNEEDFSEEEEGEGSEDDEEIREIDLKKKRLKQSPGSEPESGEDGV